MKPLSFSSNIEEIESVNNIIKYHNKYDINVVEPNTPPPPQEPHPNNIKNQKILKELLWSLYQKEKKNKRSHKNIFSNLNTESKINKILNQQLKNTEKMQ